MAERRIIRIDLSEVDFRKYKVLCAIADVSMTKQTNVLIKHFIEESEKEVKIIRTDKNIPVDDI